jgi:uncharacterized repeat protein (TIGR03803 family)
MHLLIRRNFFWIAALVAVSVTHVIAQSTGAGPSSGVIRDSEGNLYGTTSAGGTDGDGVVYKLTPAGEETVLYSFKGQPDGTGPQGVIEDSANNFYGTTTKGGAYNGGTVFELSSTGIETVLYSFAASGTGAVGPDSGVIQDSDGNLYGETYEGGTYTQGTVYKLSPSGTLTILYSFKGGANGDGGAPGGGLIRDSEGNLYGTAGAGPKGFGIVFEISPTGTETIIYSFKGGTTDGVSPTGGVVRDSEGNLYGTTSLGGTKNYGTVFKISATGSELLLYCFTTLKDGDHPEGGVILDSKGNMYGTTEFGGPDTDGNVFRISPAGKEKVLFTFTGLDGEFPIAPLLRDSEGNLYGTTEIGGPSNDGVVFELSTKDVETILCTF